MSDLLLTAFLGGVGVVLAAGPLGCFVVWRRMAYFGDSLAHSALLGIVLAFFYQANFTLGILVVAVLFALLLMLLERQNLFSSDTLLGILAHGALSLGVVLIALSNDLRIDLSAYLFGDILALGVEDIITIYGISAIILAALAWCWRPLMMLTLSPEVATVEGVPVRRYKLVLMLMIAILVASAIKAVGVLLITSLLIIPAAAARYYARTPNAMAWGAALLGVVGVGGGLYASFHLDAPSGPSIVLALIALFIVSPLVRKFTSRRSSGV